MRLIKEDADRDALRTVLLPVLDMSTGELAGIINNVQGVLPVDAENAATLDDLVGVLDLAATPPGKVPALILFLASLAARKSEIHGAIWAWIDECAPRLTIEPAALAPLRNPSPESTQLQRVHAALAVMDENPYSTRRYQLSRWLRWDNGRTSHKHDERVPRSKEELCASGEGMLGKFHRDLPVRCR